MTTTSIDTRIAELTRAWHETPADEHAIALYHALKRAGAEIPWKVQDQAEEALERRDPIGKLARVWSSAGPCFLHGTAGSGRIKRETAKFYWVAEVCPWKGTEAKPKRIAKSKVHLKPCNRCTDHPNTSYPHGYQN